MKLDTFVLGMTTATLALNLYWAKINREQYNELKESSKKLSGYQDDFIENLTRFNKMITSLDIVDGRTNTIVESKD